MRDINNPPPNTDESLELYNMSVLANVTHLMMDFAKADPDADWVQDLFVHEQFDDDCSDFYREPISIFVVSSEFGDFLKENDQLVSFAYPNSVLWGRETYGISVMDTQLWYDYFWLRHSAQNPLP